MLIIASLPAQVHADEKTYKRTIEKYSIPDLVLINQNGTKIHIKTLLESKKPVILDFIFSTCTSICPILSSGFANLQQELGADSQNVQFVSITIDPDNDTPGVMKEYLKRYGAKPGWDFLTGSRTDIEKAMLAFHAYVPNKLYRSPLTFIKPAGDSSWIRLFGLLSDSEFILECKKAGIH